MPDTLFERMSRLAAQGRNPDPIDTSTLGPIKHDPNAEFPWRSPVQCCNELLRLAANPDKDGNCIISAAKLKALDRIIARWPDRPIEHCPSGWDA